MKDRIPTRSAFIGIFFGIGSRVSASRDGPALLFMLSLGLDIWAEGGGKGVASQYAKPALLLICMSTRQHSIIPSSSLIALLTPFEASMNDRGHCPGRSLQ